MIPHWNVIEYVRQERRNGKETEIGVVPRIGVGETLLLAINPPTNAYIHFRFDSCSTTLPILSELIGKEDMKGKTTVRNWRQRQ